VEGHDVRRLLAVLVAGAIFALASCTPDNATWDRLAACESGGNWSAVSYSGPVTNRHYYYGGLLMDDAIWVYGAGGFGHANAYSRTQQIAVANVIWQKYHDRGLNGFTWWAQTGQTSTSCPVRLGLYP
jgi:Transglycosylase-like domain